MLPSKHDRITTFLHVVLIRWSLQESGISGGRNNAEGILRACGEAFKDWDGGNWSVVAALWG